MIAVQDLCIGNWVYDGERTQFPMQVVGIGTDYVYLDFEGNEGDLWESKPEDLQGIPLTEELLEKIGFSFKYGIWRHQLGVKVMPDIGFVSFENNDSEHWLYSTCNCNNVWYLHQLQNSVRIITKKELKVNLWNK